MREANILCCAVCTDEIAAVYSDDLPIAYCIRCAHTMEQLYATVRGARTQGSMTDEDSLATLDARFLVFRELRYAQSKFGIEGHYAADAASVLDAHFAGYETFQGTLSPHLKRYNTQENFHEILQESS